MTEILIVISIIVLLLAIAVPAFNLIRGSRSVDSAQNQVSAMLGRARADAIGLQKPHGIMFFIEPTSDRVNIALVYAADFPSTASNREVYLDMVADTDFVALPPGVLACTMSDGGNPVVRDRYLGYNNTINGTTPVGNYYGGVILFGSNGQLISRTYGFLTQKETTPGVFVDTRIATVLGIPAAAPGFVEAGQTPKANAASSSLGVALCDWVAFKSGRDVEDPLLSSPGYPISEQDEETWLDNNSTPLLINRYNGTLIESQ